MASSGRRGLLRALRRGDFASAERILACRTWHPDMLPRDESPRWQRTLPHLSTERDVRAGYYGNACCCDDSNRLPPDSYVCLLFDICGDRQPKKRTSWHLAAAQWLEQKMDVVGGCRIDQLSFAIRRACVCGHVALADWLLDSDRLGSMRLGGKCLCPGDVRGALAALCRTDAQPRAAPRPPQVARYAAVRLAKSGGRAPEREAATRLFARLFANFALYWRDADALFRAAYFAGRADLARLVAERALGGGDAASLGLNFICVVLVRLDCECDELLDWLDGRISLSPEQVERAWHECTWHECTHREMAKTWLKQRFRLDDDGKYRPGRFTKAAERR